MPGVAHGPGARHRTVPGLIVRATTASRSTRQRIDAALGFGSRPLRMRERSAKMPRPSSQSASHSLGVALASQLDPGFTQQGFLAQVAVQAIAAMLGTLGALAVAWFIFRRTTEKDRQTFRQQIAHDLEMRRHEDANRRAERDEIQQTERRRLLLALLAEFEGNFQAIAFMKVNPPGRIPLRRTLLDANLGDIADLPTPVAAAIQKVSLHVDQYNAVPEGEPVYIDSFTIAENMIEEAAGWLARYLKGEVIVEEPATH